MKLFKRLLAKAHPVCPIALGEHGPHEYKQLMKDGKLVMETPLSCLRFLKIHEFMLKRYQEDPERTHWINIYDLDRIRAHKHTVIRDGKPRKGARS